MSAVHWPNTPLAHACLTSSYPEPHSVLKMPDCRQGYGCHISSCNASCLAFRATCQSPRHPPPKRDVLPLMAEGLPNKLIAARLAISEHTAKFHVSAIMTKLGAASRTEAVTIGARRGLLIL